MWRKRVVKREEVQEPIQTYESNYFQWEVKSPFIASMQAFLLQLEVSIFVMPRTQIITRQLLQ